MSRSRRCGRSKKLGLAEQKNKVATLFAYQLLRGHRWRAERGDHTMEFIQELRRTGRLDDDKGTARVLTPEEREHLDEVQAHLLGSTTHWTRMLVMGLTFSGCSPRCTGRSSSSLCRC